MTSNLNPPGVSTRIQVRNVPEELHRRVKARAALSGLTMSEFILHELERALARPTREELLDRIARLQQIELDDSPAKAGR